MKDQTHDELAAAVNRYEADLWPRGNEAVLASLENTNAVHDWTTMLQSPLFTAGLVRVVEKDEMSTGEVEVVS